MSESVPTIEGDDDVHLRWMREAMRMVRTNTLARVHCQLRANQAEEAMAAKEVPVGCVFVRDNKIIAKARNRTNELRNVRPPPLIFHSMLNVCASGLGNQTRRVRSNRRHSLGPIPHSAGRHRLWIPIPSQKHSPLRDG